MLRIRERLIVGAVVVGLVGGIFMGSKPTDVQAETVVKSINLNTNGSIPGISDPTVPTDTTKAWTGTKVNFGKAGITFRVLDASTTDYNSSPTMFLDADEVLENKRFSEWPEFVWEGSEMRIYLNDVFMQTNFTPTEQEAIVSSTRDIQPAANVFPYGVIWTPLDSDKIFLLDVFESLQLAYGYSSSLIRVDNRIKKMSGFEQRWWLRSAHSNGSDVFAVNEDGTFSNYYVINTTIGIAPALNLDISSVIFTSVANVSKPDSFTLTNDEDSTEWNLTLAGGTGFAATRTDSGKVLPGNAVSVNVSEIGIPKTDVSYTQISAMLVDQKGDVIVYGKVKGDATTGDISITIPAEVTEGDYHLKLFAEDVNSLSNDNDNATDYCSNMVNFDIEVRPQYTVNIDSDNTNMTISNESGNGSSSQTVFKDVAITDVIYTANEGYFFPEDYAVETLNGIQVERLSTTQIKVTGTPTDNTDLLLSPASEKVNATSPQINTQPSGGAIVEGSNYTMSVDAITTDGGILSYQWYMCKDENGTDGTPIEGAIGASYTMEGSAVKDFYYYAVITNTNAGASGDTKTATVTSNVIKVTVQAKEQPPTPPTPPKTDDKGAGTNTNTGSSSTTKIGTGDNADMMFWIVLGVIAFIVVLGTFVYRKKFKE